MRISAALDLNGAARDALMESARARVTRVANGDLPDAPLPIPPTTLVGRENDLGTLHEWLEDSAVRLITLTGTGGAGKTRLALELARRLASDGRTRVVFVPLAAVRDPELVAPAIAEAFGLSDVSAADLTRCVRPACEDQPTWIVLDNFEQVLDAAILVADLVAGIPSIRVLVTSRAALRVRGEREFPVGPLDLEVDETLAPLADLARTPAVRLFLERVRDVEPGFQAHVGEQRDRDVNLPAPRCASAGAGTGGAVDEGAFARRASSPPVRQRAAGASRCPRPSRAAADDERHRRVELSVALAGRAAAVSPARRSAGKVLDRRCCRRAGR